MAPRLRPASPWLGRSALDAVQVWLRDANGAAVEDLLGRMRKAADGAAMATETRAKVTVLGSVHDPLCNEVLGRTMQKQLLQKQLLAPSSPLGYGFQLGARGAGVAGLPPWQPLGGAMARGSRSLTRRGLIGGVALGLLGSGCGYLLYPERRGRRSGVIDGGVLIVDVLWLLPGLLPGIICLVVDFSTGCIYASGSSAAGAQPAGEPVKVAIDVGGRQIARGEVQPDGRAHLVWSEPTDVETLRAHGRIIAIGGEDNIAQAHLGELI